MHSSLSTDEQCVVAPKEEHAQPGRVSHTWRMERLKGPERVCACVWCGVYVHLWMGGK